MSDLAIAIGVLAAIVAVSAIAGCGWGAFG